MTSEIVQSDIDLTRRMLESRRPDHEIIRILGKRGIDADRAALLIDDLRYGRKVVPHLPVGYQITPRDAGEMNPAETDHNGAPVAMRKPSVPQASRVPQSLAEETVSSIPTPASTTEDTHLDPAAEVQANSHRMPIIAGAVVLLLLSVLGLAVWQVLARIGQYTQAPNAEVTQNRSAVPLPSTTAVASTTGNGLPAQYPVNTLILDLDTKGLRLSGAQLQRQNALGLLMQRLGPATRTNSVPDADRTFFAHAFDADGVIVHCTDGNEATSLVLDFTGGDSVMRALNPFSGTMRLFGKRISQYTAPSNVVALLGTNFTGAKEGLVQGRVADLELVFMTTTTGLDFLVIDFK